jgi:hypothetical protein
MKNISRVSGRIKRQASMKNQFLLIPVQLKHLVSLLISCFYINGKSKPFGSGIQMKISGYLVNCVRSKSILSLPVLTILFSFSLFGQPFQVCTAPGTANSCKCSTAPVICTVAELDGYTFQMSTFLHPADGPTPMCPGGNCPPGQSNSTASNNPTWVAFRAVCSEFSLTLNFSGCSGNGCNRGLQAAIYSDCNDLPGSVVNGGCSSCYNCSQGIGCGISSGQRVMDISDLIPGQTYYLLVDGCGGSACSVTIEVDLPPGCDDSIGPWMGPINGTASLCAGDTATYWVNMPEGGINSTWVIKDINGNLIETLDDGGLFVGPPPYTKTRLPVLWNMGGTYQICVDVYNTCIPASASPAELCKIINVYDAEAGTITAFQTTGCPGTAVNLLVTGHNTSFGVSQYILVANSIGQIVQVTPGSNTTYSYNGCGTFTAYSYNIVTFLIPPNTPVVGQNISSIISGCDLSCCEIASVPFSFSDNVPPLFINPPPNIIVDCIDNVPPMSALNYLDNCLALGSQNGIESGNYGNCGGSIFRTWTVTDLCNNTATYVQTITIQEPMPAAFINPPVDITVSCPSASDTIFVPILTYSNGMSGSCGINGSIFPVRLGEIINCNGVYTYIWTFTDQCGRTISHTSTVTYQKSCLPDYVPTSGLVGYWPFCGNANDESGNGNDGIVSGATLTKDRFGNDNMAYNFDGISDFIDCGNSNSVNINGEITISAWINANNFDIDHGIVSKSGLYNLITSAPFTQPPLDKLRFEVGNVPFLFSNPIQSNQWLHVVSVYSAINGKSIYINGKLYASNPQVGVITSNNIYNLYLGSHQPFAVNNWSWDGKLDDIGIWNRALTEDEIKGLYQSNQCNIAILKDTENICKGDSVGLKVVYTDTSYFQDIRNKGWQYVTSYSGKSYWLYKERRNWYDAVSLCADNGGQLFCPNTKEENDLVAVPITTITPYGDFWIGLYQDRNDSSYSEPAGGFKWIDGSPLIYTNWHPGEPSGSWEDHVILDWSNWGDEWNDLNGVNQGSIIMEYDPLKNANILWSNGETTQEIKAKVNGPITYIVSVTAVGVGPCIDSIALNINNCCFPDYVPTVGLVGFWPFCGNANDESGNGNNGNLNGGSFITDRRGLVDSAIGLLNSGSNAKVNNITPPFNNIGLTVSVWLKLSNQFNYSTLAVIKNGIPYTNGFDLAIDQNNSAYGVNNYLVIFLVGNGTAVTFKSNQSELGQWSHVVATYDGNLIKIYLNGILKATQPFNLSLNCPNNDLIFGEWDNNTLPTVTDRNIDDVGIWNRALTEVEIKDLYDGSVDTTFTLAMDTLIGLKNQEIVMPVRVKNFKDILYGQGSISFDPLVISLVGVEDFGIDYLSPASFNLNEAASGKLSFVWSQSDLLPASLPDEDMLFSMRFRIVGSHGSFSDISFTEDPVPAQFINESISVVSPISLHAGRIEVDSEAALKGVLFTEDQHGIRSATVRVTGDASKNTFSALDGTYGFTLPEDMNYQLTPSKNNDTLVRNGINVADALRVQRHILGTLKLNSPYKTIAADVNQSGDINGLDVVLINAFIVGKTQSFPGGKLWRFVPSDYIFANPQKPFPFPESRTYNPFTGDENANFIGMKLGDVDNSYNPQVPRGLVQDRIKLYTDNQEAASIVDIRVPVRVENFDSISGFQFAVRWDASVLKYKGNLNGGDLKLVTGESDTEKGALNVAWVHPQAAFTSIPNGEPVLTLLFEGIGAPGSSSSVAVIDSETTPIEVINNDLENVLVEVNNGTVTLGSISGISDPGSNGNISVRVYPNPMNQYFRIEINSKKADHTILTIYDMGGQLVYRDEMKVSVGENTYLVKMNQPVGSYLVRIQDKNGEGIFMRKIVKVE